MRLSGVWTDKASKDLKVAREQADFCAAIALPAKAELALIPDGRFLHQHLRDCVT